MINHYLRALAAIEHMTEPETEQVATAALGNMSPDRAIAVILAALHRDDLEELAAVIEEKLSDKGGAA